MSDDEVRRFTSDLCRHSSSVTYEQLERRVVERAKLCLVEWLGLAIRGSREELALAIHSVIISSELSGRASVFGTSLRTNELFAALANGAQGHAIDFDDTHAPSLTHVSSSLWPAILAVAQTRGYSGRQIICSYVVGVDSQVEIGNHVGSYLTARGFHATAILGHIGAAISVSNLLSLNAEMTEQAVGIAATQAAGLRASFGTMSKPLHPGKAAMNGLLAVQLAMAGFTGPRNVIERSDGLLATLLDRVPTMGLSQTNKPGYSVLEISFKPYPSCLLTHPSIDAAAYLGKEFGFSSSQVDSVECHVNPLAIKVAGNARPVTDLEAKFSVQFCVAVALLNGTVRESDFTQERVGDAEISVLSQRVVLVPDDSLSPIQAFVRLRLKDGSQLEHTTEVSKGNPANPMTKEESLGKFSDLVSPTFGSERASELALLCLEVEELTNLSGLFDSQRAGARQ